MADKRKKILRPDEVSLEQLAEMIRERLAWVRKHMPGGVEKETQVELLGQYLEEVRQAQWSVQYVTQVLQKIAKFGEEEE